MLARADFTDLRAPDVFPSYTFSPSIVTSHGELLKPGRTYISRCRTGTYRVAAGQKTIKSGYRPSRRFHHFSSLSPLNPLLLWSTYGRYMLSIQFRSHLWFSPTHRRAAPYVIFILFIVSRSHPTAWVNIFLRDRVLSMPYFVSLTSLPRRDIFFENDNPV